jgi:hypothetical protein
MYQSHMWEPLPVGGIKSLESFMMSFRGITNNLFKSPLKVPLPVVSDSDPPVVVSDLRERLMTLWTQDIL